MTMLVHGPNSWVSFRASLHNSFVGRGVGLGVGSDVGTGVAVSTLGADVAVVPDLSDLRVDLRSGGQGPNHLSYVEMLFRPLISSL